MKENQTCDRSCPQVCSYCTDELPPCLPRPKKLKEPYLFLEEWELKRDQVKYDIFQVMKGLELRGCSMMERAINKIQWGGRYMKEWETLNPSPNLNRNEFIVTLAKRVETLEAALAEKGGNQ